jgi:hypothetical protein
MTATPRAAPRPVTFRHVIDALDATDAALQRLLEVPRLRRGTRAEIQRIITEHTSPILIRTGRRLIALLLGLIALPI